MIRGIAAAICAGLFVAGTVALAKDSDAQQGTAAARAAAPKPASQRAEPARPGRGAKAAAKRKDNDANAVAALEHEGPSPANFSPDIGWRMIEDPVTGARLGLPEKFVPRAGTSHTGSRWSSAQGQIQVETFRLAEAALPALFEQEKKTARREIVSSQLKTDSFVIVGVQGLKNFLMRADARGSEVRGITILYDQATEGRMEVVGAAMLSAFTGFPDPNAAPPPGVRRMVEYATAIVVGSNGDLIVPARAVDDCQIIAVPGLGHAERIAEDSANDLALIRLYGARNLTAMPIAANAAGDVTLVGIADPLAQAGGGAVTSVAARAGAQGLDPAPKPGFSGAAAADARGALAGMVDLKPQVVAGNSPAGPAATLVPGETIRVFLAAHDVTPAAPAAERAPAEQSVVRVVCVRK